MLYFLLREFESTRRYGFKILKYLSFSLPLKISTMGKTLVLLLYLLGQNLKEIQLKIINRIIKNHQKFKNRIIENQSKVKRIIKNH